MRYTFDSIKVIPHPEAPRLEIFPARATEDDLAEAGRRLFARPVRFVAGAGEPAALPPGGPPEIAFAGRSNVC